MRLDRGWNPDESLTPEGLEDLLEGPGLPADQELHIHAAFEAALAMAEAPEPGSFVDNGLEYLTDAECYELLNRALIGRVGISMAGVPIILPVRYAMVGDDVVFFTGEGLKLDAAHAGKTMTFEIDSYDARRSSGWSVLIVGAGEEITRPEIYGDGAETLHPAAPGLRDRIVRIRPDVISGRRFGVGRS